MQKTQAKITGIKRKHLEADEQCKLMKWADTAATLGIHPELKLLHATPNGGRRDKIEAAHLKRQGVKPGVPDLFLPVARGEYHGMFIEMKIGKNKLTDNQKKWRVELVKENYFVAVCYSALEAKKMIESYLKL